MLAVHSLFEGYRLTQKERLQILNNLRRIREATVMPTPDYSTTIAQKMTQLTPFIDHLFASGGVTGFEEIKMLLDKKQQQIDRMELKMSKKLSAEDIVRFKNTLESHVHMMVNRICAYHSNLNELIICSVMADYYCNNTPINTK